MTTTHRIHLFLVFGLVILLLPVIIASHFNTKKFYLRASDGAIEIWQGRFAPTTRKHLLTLPGIKAPASTKPVYTRAEVYPFAFQYYTNKAGAVLEVPGMPDFDGIKSYLNQALTYAITDEHRRAVISRVTGIDILVLIYRADVSAGKGTLAALETALDYLHQADKLDLDNQQSDIIHQKSRSIKRMIKTLSDYPAE